MKKEITIIVDGDLKNEIKSKACLRGETMNSYIVQAVKARMEADGDDDEAVKEIERGIPKETILKVLRKIHENQPLNRTALALKTQFVDGADRKRIVRMLVEDEAVEIRGDAIVIADKHKAEIERMFK